MNQSFMIPNRENFLDALHEKHRDDLRRYIARSLGPDRAAADDVLHDVFVRALAQPSRVPAGEDARPWLFRVATNLVIDHHRAARVRRGGSPVTEPRSAAPSPEDDAIRGELRQRIRDAVARLPDEQREVFLMREYGDVPFKDIAERLGAPLGTVLARMHHAMLRVRREVEGDVR